ncbi:hypothetical protein F66182_6824 [Fusarium sp. NRRL 66182]|nr:hypothetical protein F66182_6824 [Fusarium sp. NRRL 66182]
MMSDSFREMPTQPAARSTKPVRLRLACDACTTAKVRCSKTHPCERCEDMGLEKECYYSASRRHGKRARHRKTASETQRSSSSSDTATPATLTTPGCGFSGAHYGSDLTWEDCRSNAPSYPASKLDSELEMLDSWAFHNIDLTLEFDHVNYIPLADPWKTLAPASELSPSQSSGLISPESSLSTEQTLSIKTGTPASTISGSSSMQGPRQLHDCEAMALKLLRSLHCNSNMDQNADICTEHPQHNTAASNMALANQTCTMPSIDTVLFANKAALNNLMPLLKCPCARNPHIAILHSAILSKVIFWYRVAVTARYHTEGMELRPMKIQLGMLDLDEDDHAMLQRTILLGEVRKAEKVMEAFDSYSKGEDEGPSWHASAMKNMREELQAIIQKIKRGQGEII